MKKKKLIIVSLITILCLVVVGYFLNNQRKSQEIERLDIAIQQSIESLKKQKSNQYFPEEVTKEIEVLDKERLTQVSEKNLEGLESVDQKVSELKDKTTEYISELEDAYSSIKQNLDKSETLQNNYFAKDFDLSELKADSEEAKKVIDSKDFKNYKNASDKLNSQVELYEEKIERKMSSIASVPTNKSREYPYAIDITSFSDETTWDFQPIIIQSSKNPVWILKNAPIYTDKPSEVNLFVDGSSSGYNYSFTEIPTKEIQVEVERGKYKTALVNTQLSLKLVPGYIEEHPELYEKPIYFFKADDGKIYLALQEFENGEYYILYTGNVY